MKTAFTLLALALGLYVLTRIVLMSLGVMVPQGFGEMMGLLLTACAVPALAAGATEL